MKVQCPARLTASSRVLIVEKLMYARNASYPLSIAFIKIALVFQYLRIFEPLSRNRILCKAFIVLVGLWGVTFALITWIPCVPVAAYWDSAIKDARCWGLGSHDVDEYLRFFVSQAISTTILDFIIFVIPARIYFQSNVSRKTRVYMALLFGLGLMYVASVTLACLVAPSSNVSGHEAIY